MRPGTIAALLLAAAALPPAAAGGAPATVQVVTDRSAEIDVRLLLREDGRQREVRAEHLSGAPDARLPLAERVATAAGDLAVGLVLVPREEGAPGRCTLDVESDVSSGAAPPARVRRRVTAAARRVALTDIWSDGASRGLVLATSCRWQETPRIVELTGDAQPIEVVVELLLSNGGAPELVERHRMRGLVGAPLRYAFGQRSGAADAHLRGRLVLEVTARALEQDAAQLAITLRHDGESRHGLSAVAITIEESLPSGAALDIPLPGPPGDPRLLFRLRPVF